MMSEQSTQAESCQEILFRHRFSDFTNPDLSDVAVMVDTVGLMTERAASILHILSSQFSGGEQLNDQILHSAVYAAIAEVEDIQAIVSAYGKIVRNKSVSVHQRKTANSDGGGS